MNETTVIIEARVRIVDVPKPWDVEPKPPASPRLLRVKRLIAEATTDEEVKDALRWMQETQR